MSLYPLTFQPIFKERVWGGRKLQELYGKPLPPGKVIGESWEISDRPGDVSVVTNGPMAGCDLHTLLEKYGRELLGPAETCDGRFPLLIKLLDAREKLSVQVHPPAAKALQLGGEPKTEMWYIADADPGASLYVGLRKHTSRSEFEQHLQAGTLEKVVYQVPVSAGDTMFLPSGRIHAIGTGLVIFEIQQNSDTTYRVFDWNRLGLDGKPRELHVRQSLESIDFNDYEPMPQRPGLSSGLLVADPLFRVELKSLDGAEVLNGGALIILGVTEGVLETKAGGTASVVRAGEFVMLPAALPRIELASRGKCSYLQIAPGQA